MQPGNLETLDDFLVQARHCVNYSMVQPRQAAARVIPNRPGRPNDVHADITRRRPRRIARVHQPCVMHLRLVLILIKVLGCLVPTWAQFSGSSLVGLKAAAEAADPAAQTKLSDLGLLTFPNELRRGINEPSWRAGANCVSDSE